MVIKDKYFPSQTKDEQVFLLIRRHWVVFLTMSIFSVFFIMPLIVLLVYWVNNPEVFSGILGNIMLIFSSMYILTVMGLLLYGFVNYYLDIYIVTNKRIVSINQNGFFRREIAELHLHQVQDVEAKVEGFYQTMLHFGTIYIQTAGERENFVFQDVPHPYTLAKKIVELHEQQIESEYENHPHNRTTTVDDYRPEDYSSSGAEATKIGIDKKFALDSSEQQYIPEENGFKETESVDSSDNNNYQEMASSDEKNNFAASDQQNENQKEFSEGEEIRIDGREK